MISLISSYLWIGITFFVVITSIYLLFYFNFTSLKELKNVKSINKNNLKLLYLSLAGKIGVGSISGIAFSIIIGGKGSILWIWVSSIFLSIYLYLETKAGMLYKNNKIGGPYYFIKHVLKKNKLSIIYILLIIFTFLFSFILIQSNTIIVSLNNSLFINKKILLIILIFIVYYSINNELNKIYSIVSILVPIMGILYFFIGLYILINNLNIISTIIVDIFKDSIKIRSFLSIPFIVGFQRAIFSNESGMGTTSMIVSLSESEDYKKEYLIQSLGMFFITLIICTISAIVVLTSNYESLDISDINGIEIINYSFNYHFGKYGSIISSIIITMFAYSTIITSFYYGDLSIKYLFNNKNNTIVKFIVIIILVLSIYVNPKNVWSIIDISVGLTTIINVYALIKARKKLKE